MSRDDLAELYSDVFAIWRPWTTELSGCPSRGYHVAEDAPEELAARLSHFLALTLTPALRRDAHRPAAATPLA